MKTAYLSNGQSCYIKEEIGNKYIVKKLFEVEGEYGIEEIEGEDAVVEKVFFTKPVEKIEKEIKDLILKKEQTSTEVSELEKNKRNLERELSSLTTTHISNQKFIINRTELLNAKMLVLFPKDSIMPLSKEVGNGYRSDFKVSLTVCIGDGKQQSWGYRVDTDGREGISHYLCEKYGMLIDPTEEQIEEVIFKRVAEFEFSDWVIKRTPDKYLTPEMLARKNEYISNERIKEKANLEKQLVDLTEKLKKYEQLS